MRPANLAPFAWSLLLAAGVVVFSTVPLGAARSQANFQVEDLAAPRAMFERLPAWGKRAAWAHQNCFEALTLHAPAALLCLLAGVGSPVAHSRPPGSTQPCGWPTSAPMCSTFPPCGGSAGPAGWCAPGCSTPKA